ncbi:MAG: hypothetical protein ACLQUY_04210 [Ktedonobacterales bacterium]
MITNSTSIHTYLADPVVDVFGLAEYLDHLDASARLREVRSLGKHEQAKLFEATGARPIDLTHFVPEGTPPLREVAHYGRNSLSALHTFAKRFCRPDASTNELWGYNEHPLSAVIGPGYFIVHSAGPQEVIFDYTIVPPSKLAAWPQIRPNSERLSRFVYYGTRDTVRGVSRHVVVGRVIREGHPLDAWFVLCRAGDG